jgi:hypothetical protein
MTKKYTLPIIIIFTFFVGVFFIFNSPLASAITCPDGSFLPDERADECPPSPGTAGSAGSDSGNNNASDSSNFGCVGGSNAEECAQINPGGAVSSSDGSDGKQCGRQADDGSGSEIVLSINVGCRGESWPTPINPIVDMAFAFIRFISAGVGLVIIGSIIWAGIQYSVSRGNPQSTEAAINRITNTFFALMFYLFTYAIANFLVPGGMFL